MLNTNPHLGPRLNKEYSSISVPILGLHGLLHEEILRIFYIATVPLINVLNAVIHTGCYQVPSTSKTVTLSIANILKLSQMSKSKMYFICINQVSIKVHKELTLHNAIHVSKVLSNPRPACRV